MCYIGRQSAPQILAHSFVVRSPEAGRSLLQLATRCEAPARPFTLLTFLEMIVKDRCRAAAERVDYLYTTPDRKFCRCLVLRTRLLLGFPRS